MPYYCSWAQQYSKLSTTPSDFTYAHNYDTGLHITDSQNIIPIRPIYVQRRHLLRSSTFNQHSSLTSYHPREHYSTFSFPPDNNTTHNITVNENGICANIYNGNIPFQQRPIFEISLTLSSSFLRRFEEYKLTHYSRQHPPTLRSCRLLSRTLVVRLLHLLSYPFHSVLCFFCAGTG